MLAGTQKGFGNSPATKSGIPTAIAETGQGP
jgi:hypothetical protein